jgi:hypothetical protein
LPNNHIQKTGADSACQGHATLPAPDMERWAPPVKSVKTDKQLQPLNIMLKDSSSAKKDAYSGFNDIHH